MIRSGAIWNYVRFSDRHVPGADDVHKELEIVSKVQLLVDVISSSSDDRPTLSSLSTFLVCVLYLEVL